MLPDFIIGGVMKSGTTYLHNLLNNHKDISVMRNMDYAFFDDDRIYKSESDWYQNVLIDFVNNLNQKNQIIGQTSADCAFNPNSIDRILDYCKRIKLIFVLRHPIDRAYSLYWHQYRMGREYRSFEKAIYTESTITQKSYHHFKHYSYLGRSRYSEQFPEIINKIPSSNLLLLSFDALTNDTKDTINIILNFLDAENIKSLEELNYSRLPKNRARIPKNSIIPFVSYHLQQIGMTSIARRFINMLSDEKRPPKMDENLRKKLEDELKNDIKFYNKVKQDFQQLIYSIKNKK